MIRGHRVVASVFHIITQRPGTRTGRLGCPAWLAWSVTRGVSALTHGNRGAGTVAALLL